MAASLVHSDCSDSSNFKEQWMLAEHKEDIDMAQIPSGSAESEPSTDNYNFEEEEQLFVEHKEEKDMAQISSGSAESEHNSDGVFQDIQNIQEKKKTVKDRRGVKFETASSLSTRRKFTVGLVIVAVIAGSWVGSTQTAKSSYNGKFAAPFFLMWFETAWVMVMFPLTSLVYFLTGQGKFNPQGIRDLWSHCTKVVSPHGITLFSFLTSTVLFALIWVGTSYMFSRALMTIAASDVTALFSSAPAFVFLFSICILREPPLILRLLAVVAAVAGIVLFAYQDGFKSTSIVGIVLSVGAAIGAALYKVLLKWRVGDASLYQMSLFLSMIGLFSTLTLWPILLLLHLLHVEVLVDIPWGYICASSALGVVFKFSIHFGIAYTFPLFISLGTILGIPLNAIVDVIVRHIDFLNWKFLATDLIVGGFLLMLVPPSDSIFIHKAAYRMATCKTCRDH